MKRRDLLNQLGKGILSLPFLGSLSGLSTSAAELPRQARRLVCIGLDLSLRPEAFFPDVTGSDYQLSPLLRPLERWREQMTIISRSEHPGVSGGHVAAHAWLSGVRREQRHAFDEGCLSLDQRIAEHFEGETRISSLCLGVGKGDSISWTRSGVNLIKEMNPSTVYESIFTVLPEKDRRREQMRSIQDRQIAALIHADAKRVKGHLDEWDRDKLEEFAESVNEFERHLRIHEKWIDSPVPPAERPLVGWSSENCLTQLRAQLDVTSLALAADATRVATINIGQALPVAGQIAGVNRGYHDLSHSGKDPDKLQELARIETALVKEFDRFLERLSETKGENGESLLDSTIVLIGSGMGNASSHSNLDLPIIVAGGDLRHGRHIHFEKAGRAHTPLCNLYVTILQQMGIEADQFGTSDGNLNEMLA